MIYLTTVNFSRFIRTLELDIPSYYRNNFYWRSKLTHFAVDLAHFPATQAKVLVLANMLFQDIEKTMSLKNKRNGFKSKRFPCYILRLYFMKYPKQR